MMTALRKDRDTKRTGKIPLMKLDIREIHSITNHGYGCGRILKSEAMDSDTLFNTVRASGKKNHR